jgi:choline kinase
MVKAIILAAGMGTRLGKYTKDLPKGMLNFNGKSLIEWQVETLRACGINDIVIIKGYMPDKINISGVKYYINNDFVETNMVETLFTAEKEMDDEILVCYSDILYEKEVIRKILDAKVDVGVTVDEDYWEYWKARLDEPEDDTESLIIDDDGKIIDLGDTDCSIDKAKVRYVGLIKFSQKGIESLKNVYHENKDKYFDKDEPWLMSKSFKKAYMTCMLQAIINTGQRVDPIRIRHGWLEFDTIEDYERTSNWLKTGNLERFFKISNE